MSIFDRYDKYSKFTFAKAAERCAIEGGSDPEYAELAVKDYRTLIAGDSDDG